MPAISQMIHLYRSAAKETTQKIFSRGLRRYNKFLRAMDRVNWDKHARKSWAALPVKERVKLQKAYLTRAYSGYTAMMDILNGRYIVEQMRAIETTYGRVIYGRGKYGSGIPKRVLKRYGIL